MVITVSPPDRRSPAALMAAAAVTRCRVGEDPAGVGVGVGASIGAGAGVHA